MAVIKRKIKVEHGNFQRSVIVCVSVSWAAKIASCVQVLRCFSVCYNAIHVHKCRILRHGISLWLLQWECKWSKSRIPKVSK